MANIFFYQTTIGKLGIAEEAGKITNLYFESSFVPDDKFEHKETETIVQAYKQLYEYFEGKRKKFELDLAPVGTDFRLSVWQALTEIPYGETRSYKQIAQRINNSLAYRAVGLANNKNPIPIFIPCHRVIGSDKKLVGFGGGLEVKKKLLEIERQSFLSYLH